MIQLDPLDRIGTNADLVALARLDGVCRGDVYRHLLPGHGFEHFAKERCLLPPSAFAYYARRSAEAPWWRLHARLKRLPEALIADVLAEITERGPLGVHELTGRGKVAPLDWHGWHGTGRAATMAVEVLWTRCQVVVVGRTPAGKVYDVPERALPAEAAATPRRAFAEWAVPQRVEAAGLLPRASGPWWSALRAARTSELPDELVSSGALEEVTVAGSSRRYLAPAGFRDREFPDDDGRMRILGPLDPLIWNRKLIEQVFGFEYIWEVYKPAKKRRWGYYVCPLLHLGRLVGRFEGRVEADELVVTQLWKEDGETFDDAAWRQALARHAAALGVGLRESGAARSPGGGRR